MSMVPENWTGCKVLPRTSKEPRMGTKEDEKFTDNFKAQVALEALRGDRTMRQEIAARHNCAADTGESAWKEAKLLKGWATLLPRAAANGTTGRPRSKSFHAKIGGGVRRTNFSSPKVQAIESPGDRRDPASRPDHPKLNLQCAVPGVEHQRRRCTIGPLPGQC